VYVNSHTGENWYLWCQNGKCAEVSCCESAGQSSLVKG